MFSGRRMWSYLIGAFVNAMVNGYIPLLIFNHTQTIQGGHPVEYWGMGFCVWSNIIFSLIFMSGSREFRWALSVVNIPRWNRNHVKFFIIALFFFVGDGREFHCSFSIFLRFCGVCKTSCTTRCPSLSARPCTTYSCSWRLALYFYSL